MRKNTIKKVYSKNIWIKILIDFAFPFAFLVGSIIITNKISMNQIDGLIIDILSFFVPLLCIDIIKRDIKDSSDSYIRRSHYIDKSLLNADIAMDSALAHLSEDCYIRCSENSNHCPKCFNKDKCSGLLRDYLNRSVVNLRKSMQDVKDGHFVLNTNIETFHTVAVEHLIGYGCKKYSVVQYLYPDAPNSVDPEYDALDYDFLKVLLHHIKELPKSKQVKVRWLFIGDEKDIKNNYDYILFVIKELNLAKEINNFIEFACISESDYSNQFTAEHNKLTPFSKRIYCKEPSVGIFGEYFAFADDLINPKNHGNIYTNYYVKEGANKGVVELLDYFETMYNSPYKRSITFSTLQTIYDTLLHNNPGWEKTLADRQVK